MKYFANLRLILALVLTIVLIAVVVNACGVGIGEQEIPPGPAQAAIYAPAENTAVLLGAPVQILSGHPNGTGLSRVELSVGRESAEGAQTIRSDNPIEGVVIQEWTPQETGQFTIFVTAFDTNGTPVSQLSRQIEVLDSQALSPQAIAGAEQPIVPEPTEVVAPLAATPVPAGDTAGSDAAVAFVVSSTSGDAAVAPTARAAFSAAAASSRRAPWPYPGRATTTSRPGM